MCHHFFLPGNNVCCYTYLEYLRDNPFSSVCILTCTIHKVGIVQVYNHFD